MKKDECTKVKMSNLKFRGIGPISWGRGGGRRGAVRVSWGGE